jgi:hypothetical protein
MRVSGILSSDQPVDYAVGQGERAESKREEAESMFVKH